MLPDRVSNPGPLTYESGALPIELRGRALTSGLVRPHHLDEVNCSLRNFWFRSFDILRISKDRNQKPLKLPTYFSTVPCHCSILAIWGGRVVLWCWVNFQCRDVLLIWIRVGQGPTALAVGAGSGCLDMFSLVYYFSFLSPALWETARYRLKYCLKGPLSPKQPTNQPTFW